MAINALIAQGIRPIGSDLPQIGQMLQEKQQSDTRNALMKDQAAQQRTAFDQSQADREARTHLAQAQFVSQASKDQVSQAFPEFVQEFEQLHGPGSWPSATDQDVQNLGKQAVMHFSTKLGMGPPQASLKSYQQWDTEKDVYEIGPDGRPRLVRAATPKAETFTGQPTAMVLNGKPVMAIRGSNGTVRPIEGAAPYEPPKTDTAPSTQLHSRPLPDGRMQDFAFDPKNPSAPLVPVGEPYAKQATIAPKDINTARMKLTQLALARKQLEQIKSKYAGLSASGPVAGYLPTAQGQGFDAAVDAIRGTFSALTRVPGVGSMSDWEGKIQQAPLPKRSQWDSTTEQKLQQVDDLITVLERGYGQMLDEAPNGAAPKAPARPQGPPAAPATESAAARAKRMGL